MHDKIVALSQISTIADEEKKKGRLVVQCHGVFDLLHPGHVRHLQEAKKQGDKLVVSLTPDRFVNKGPGRPVFSESLRLEQVASLSCVDYVVLNDSPDAVAMISRVRPSIYVKGDEYSQSSADITGKIVEETQAVEAHGGKIYFTKDIVFSSSAILNRHFDADMERLRPFLETLKASFTLEEVLEKIEHLSTMNVLIVGDAILDEYQYVNPLGLSGKGSHLAVRCQDRELFLGGSLIVANHVAAFAKHVTLLTAIGENCAHRPFIDQHLSANVESFFLPVKEFPTLTKRRYVIRDGKSLTKLFETYSSNDPLLTVQQTGEAIAFLQKKAKEYDLVLVCDFGNGFTNPTLIEALTKVPTFLALNTQMNSGNRGFHVATQYARADHVSLNEPEVRLAAHDRYRPLEPMVIEMASKLKSKYFSVTRGVNGLLFYENKQGFTEIPALTTQAIDRLGAGDSYFSLASLCAAKHYPALLSALLGSIAAAMDVQIVGNRDSIPKVGLCKYVTRLFK